MFYYILSDFFSAFSNTLGVYFVINSLIPVNRSNMLDIFLHVNILNFCWCLVFYLIQKKRDKVQFSISKTFFNKQEIVQIFLFALPIISACYKTHMMGFINISNIAISAMIKPFLVWLLALILLHEKLNKNNIKYALIALCGFFIANYNKIQINHIWFLSSYVLIAAFGDITRRFYCRKWEETFQAIFVEFTMFLIYGILILNIRGTFSFDILFHPKIFIISFLTCMHHICLIYGVRKASSVVALEFVNFSKTMFTIFFSVVLLHESILINKIIGAGIIVISLIGFNREERKAQLLLKQQKENKENN